MLIYFTIYYIVFILLITIIFKYLKNIWEQTNRVVLIQIWLHIKLFKKYHNTVSLICHTSKQKSNIYLGN